ncbi:hypothetical protein, partial [Thiolapillus sp.]|uniref:hypothetical protein n=2 Tax=Thiolapillus sp. TaxID=2017437 RepID=UPI003AF91D12
NDAPSVASDMSIDFSCVVKFQEKVCTGSGRENRCGFLGAYIVLIERRLERPVKFGQGKLFVAGITNHGARLLLVAL